MNQRRAWIDLVSDKFTIGADASAAAGPVGRDAKADTDIMLKAEMLSYSRSHGLYAGISLEGATLRPDTSENDKLYGKAMSNKGILVEGVSTPELRHLSPQPLFDARRRIAGGPPGAQLS